MMARQARQESSTGYYHVMLRGINREAIYTSDSAKKYFMELVKQQQDNDLWHLAAWCVMSNHVHLVVKSEKVAMAKAVKIISLKFAAHYNRAQDRIGPVFGGRFRSENIETDAYLLGVLRYIHHNPVKANMVQDVAHYRWSSYGEYHDEVKYLDKEQKSFVLSLFNNSLPRFAEFHAAHDDQEEYLETREDAKQYKDEWAIKIIESFCTEKGILVGKQIISNPELFEEISRRLTQQAGLSLREAAKVLEVTHNMVYRALQDE